MGIIKFINLLKGKKKNPDSLQENSQQQILYDIKAEQIDASPLNKDINDNLDVNQNYSYEYYNKTFNDDKPNNTEDSTKIKYSQKWATKKEAAEDILKTVKRWEFEIEEYKQKLNAPVDNSNEMNIWEDFKFSYDESSHPSEDEYNYDSNIEIVNTINEAIKKMSSIQDVDEEFIKEALRRYRTLLENEKDKLKQSKLNIRNTNVPRSDYKFGLHYRHDEIELVSKKDIAELIYQGYIEYEDEEYIPEEWFYYLHNDYFMYDDMKYDADYSQHNLIG